MNKRRMVLIVAVAALALAAILTRGFGLFGDGRDGELALYGNVDIREVDLGFRLGGRIDRIAVEEGDTVKAGQELAVLDAAPIDSQVAQADAALAQAEARLAELENGSRSEDKAQARARAAAARAAFRQAEQDVNRRRPLVQPGAISKAAWQATLAARDQAKAQLDEAEEAASAVLTGARAEDIAAAQAQVRAARATRQGMVVDRNDTALIAPSDGIIITRAQEPGAIVQPGATVLTLSIARPLRVRAYVAEGDLSRVATGMKVKVTADGNDKTYNGVVGFISPRAEFTPKTVETEDLRTDLVYRIRVIVNDPDDGLRQGQPVTVTLPARKEG